jgi:hypothetical protein
MMSARALLIWFGLLVAAFANAAVREVALVPRVGEGAGHAISSISLSAAILILSWCAITWIRPASVSDAWKIGGLWLALTLAFEFVAGHYVFGNPWSRLWADYNVLHGRIWILVLVTTLVAPVLAARLRGLSGGSRVERDWHNAHTR